MAAIKEVFQGSMSRPPFLVAEGRNGEVHVGKFTSLTKYTTIHGKSIDCVIFNDGKSDYMIVCFSLRTQENSPSGTEALNRPVKLCSENKLWMVDFI